MKWLRSNGKYLSGQDHKVILLTSGFLGAFIWKDHSDSWALGDLWALLGFDEALLHQAAVKLLDVRVHTLPVGLLHPHQVLSIQQRGAACQPPEDRTSTQITQTIRSQKTTFILVHFKRWELTLQCWKPAGSCLWACRGSGWSIRTRRGKIGAPRRRRRCRLSNWMRSSGCLPPVWAACKREEPVFKSRGQMCFRDRTVHSSYGQQIKA